MNRVRITVDGLFLFLVWIFLLAQLAYDAVISDQPRPVRIVAIASFTTISIVGIVWRRYWKDQIRRQAEHSELRRSARSYDRTPE